MSPNFIKSVNLTFTILLTKVDCKLGLTSLCFLQKERRENI